jgi:hypothetical protein
MIDFLIEKTGANWQAAERTDLQPSWPGSSKSMRSLNVPNEDDATKETLIKSCHAIWRPFSRLAALSGASISPASAAATRRARRENDSPSDVTAFNQCFPKSSSGNFQSAELAALEQLGGSLMTSTPAKRLVARTLADGRQEVLGVIANDGKADIAIKARKGVILGTGGESTELGTLFR